MEINNYPNYLIYDDGRVYNKKFKRFLKPYNNTREYLQLRLCHQGKKKHFLIHRLIAEYYIPNPKNKKTVDHINRDTKDNRVENLRWATQKEQLENQGIRKDNSSGHKNISYDKTCNKWKFVKQGKKTIQKYFNTKTEALCFKFIYLLEQKRL